MGKKKSQKNKGGTPQEQQQATQQQPPQATQQQPPQATQQQPPQATQQQPPQAQPGPSGPASKRGKAKKQAQQPQPSQPEQQKQKIGQQPTQHPQAKQEQVPSKPTVQGAWQRGAPQVSSHQSTPSPQPQQPIPGMPRQQTAGRGKGRGQPLDQHSGSSHSPSPQPSSGPRGQQGQPLSPTPQQHPGVPTPQYVQQPPQQQQQYMYQQQQQFAMQQQMALQQQMQQQPYLTPQQQMALQQQMQQLQFQQQQGPGQQARPPPGLVQPQQQGVPQRMPQQQQPQPPAPKTGRQTAPQSQLPTQQAQVASPQVQQVQPTRQPTRPEPVHPKQQPQEVQRGRPTQPKPPQGPEPSKPPHGLSPPLDLAIPQRKKLKSAGTNGRKIYIETNHLALILRNLNTAIHYDVVIDPDKPKKLLRTVMEAFRQNNYPQRYPAFDGTRNLYSSSELPFNREISGEVVVEEDERPKTYTVTVKYAAKVDLSVLSRYFGGGQGGSALSAGEGNCHMITPQDAIQCLDIVLRSAPALHCTPVGRSFFTKPRDQIINLGDGMEMYYGFYQSAILGWKPFLNVDVAHKAFPKSLRVIDLITELCQCDVKVRLNPYNHDTVDKFMRTLKVQYEIPGHPTSKRVMRVNALDKPSSEARFRTDDGQEMTVAEYFKNVKGYTLRCPNMPCLWVGSRARESKILFPSELCTILENQVTNRVMTPNQTSEMIKVAATSTTVRKNKIMHGIRAAHFNQDPSAREFGISVDENFAKVEARVLDAPSLRYATRSVRPQRGCWRADTFKTGRTLQRWSIVCLDDRTRPQALQEFADMMIQQGKQVGMAIERPNPIVPVRLTYRKEKQDIQQQFAKLAGMELILVVIPNENKDIYNYVKQVSELTVGTLTQCVRGKNVFRPKPATVGNILLKVNAKLNGINHVLEKRPRCLDRPCMIMGADVTHPSPESRGTVPSVAAVTASHDPQAFKYNICWRLQPPTQEIISDLANIVKQHLLFFYTQNNQMKPERIIFFRDGVSEGQFQTVLNAEVHTIRQACTMVQKDGQYKPKITFLVVQKRHHTRFFPTDPKDSEDRNYNVPAGTIVDTEITHPTALDFYLVSHASIQGVARPTKYRMLWDDNEMNEDELEQLTYHLCHLFTRCTRSVSYPAPTYYAHLAAARAKVYCERRQVDMNNLQREQEQLTVKSEIIKELPMFFV